MATFYLDHNISRRILPFLDAAGHSAITAREMRMERAGDDEQVFLAWRSGWITVTHNLDDFLLIHNTLHRWGTNWNIADTHAGIVSLPDTLTVRDQALTLDIFIASGLTIANTFYEWRSIGSWIRR